jgi:hypothetical protein
VSNGLGNVARPNLELGLKSIGRRHISGSGFWIVEVTRSSPEQRGEGNEPKFGAVLARLTHPHRIVRFYLSKALCKAGFILSYLYKVISGLV